MELVAELAVPCVAGGAGGRTMVMGPERSLACDGRVQESSDVTWTSDLAPESSWAIVEEGCLRFFEDFLSPLNESGLMGMMDEMDEIEEVVSNQCRLRRMTGVPKQQHRQFAVNSSSCGGGRGCEILLLCISGRPAESNLQLWSGMARTPPPFAAPNFFVFPLFDRSWSERLAHNEFTTRLSKIMSLTSETLHTSRSAECGRVLLFLSTSDKDVVLLELNWTW